MEADKVRIIIMNLPGPMLLVPRPTGVIYRHQYGGTFCSQAEIEGFLAPVHAAEPWLLARIAESGDDVKYIHRQIRELYVPLMGSVDDAPSYLKPLGNPDMDNEAFIPVQSLWGPAWLIYDNSD